MKICMHTGCQKLDGHAGWHGRWGSRRKKYIPLQKNRRLWRTARIGETR